MIELNDRELAAVLAALRMRQKYLRHTTAIGRSDHAYDIASDGGALEPLTAQEIEELCERINLGGSDVRSVD